MLLLLSLACSTPAPEKPKEDKPSCDLKVDTLAGTAWVHNKPQTAGPDKPDPMTRLRFRDAGGKTEADYTAGSLSNVYKYACTSDGKILTCIEQGEHAEGFCQASASVTADGKCDEAMVTAATGIDAEKVKAAAAKVNAAYAKLSAKDKETAKIQYNSPNNKVRGKFMAAVDPARCGITIQDKYETIYNGALSTYENVVGTARMVKSDQDYTWINCTDSSSSWAPDDKDEHKSDPAPGTVKFAAILQKDQLGAASCTYTADIYKDWLVAQKDVPAEKHPKDGWRWNTAIPLTDAGKHVVYFDRKKTCDGKTEPISTTCVLVNVK